jgi:hypothetical protein
VTFQRGAGLVFVRQRFGTRGLCYQRAAITGLVSLNDARWGRRFIGTRINQAKETCFWSVRAKPDNPDMFGCA